MCQIRCLKICDWHRNRCYHRGDRSDYLCTNRRADDQSFYRPCKYSRYFDSCHLFHHHVYKQKADSTEKSRLAAYVPLFIGAVMFWAIQEQGATILAVYADERIRLSLGGFELQSSWFQSLNPLFVVIFAPIFAWLWMKLGKRQPSTPVKFSIGIILAGLSFIIMVFPAMQGKEALVSPLWLVLSFLLVVLGELCLSPVGLSVTTKLAPAAFSAQTMSMWFLTNAAAQAINAQVAGLFDKIPETMYFGTIGLISIVLGGILLLLSPMIKRAMKGVL